MPHQNRKSGRSETVENCSVLPKTDKFPDARRAADSHSNIGIYAYIKHQLYSRFAGFELIELYQCSDTNLIVDLATLAIKDDCIK